MSLARKRFIKESTEVQVPVHHAHSHHKPAIAGTDPETKTLFSMLPAPAKDDASLFIVPKFVDEKFNHQQIEQVGKADAGGDLSAESSSSSEDDQIRTNVTEIRGDDLINKNDYYKSQLRSHSVLMYKKQTLERQKASSSSQLGQAIT